MLKFNGDYYLTAMPFINGRIQPKSICIAVHDVIFLLGYAKMLGVPAYVSGFGKCYTVDALGDLVIT